MGDPGLRQRILKASTPEEIEILCKLGLDFEYASDRTRNAWSNAAQRRIKELTNQDVVVPKITRTPKPVNRNTKPPKHKRQRKDA